VAYESPSWQQFSINSAPTAITTQSLEVFNNLSAVHYVPDQEREKGVLSPL
jgi:hypothetical protein